MLCKRQQKYFNNYFLFYYTFIPCYAFLLSRLFGAKSKTERCSNSTLINYLLYHSKCCIVYIIFQPSMSLFCDFWHVLFRAFVDEETAGHVINMKLIYPEISNDLNQIRKLKLLSFFLVRSCCLCKLFS